MIPPGPLRVLGRSDLPPERHRIRPGGAARRVASVVMPASVLKSDGENIHGAVVQRFAGDDIGPISSELHPVSIQRNLKALGTFGYQVTVRGQDRYRDAAARTLEHLSRTLPARRDESELYGLLSARLPELEEEPASL